MCEDVESCEILTQPDTWAGWPGRPAGYHHPPVQNWDLGRAQDVYIDIFSLEAHSGYLCLSHLPDRDVPDMVPHQADPGPLQHGEEVIVTVWPSLELR